MIGENFAPSALNELVLRSFLVFWKLQLIHDEAMHEHDKSMKLVLTYAHHSSKSISWDLF
jgi:hypothetical protein